MNELRDVFTKYKAVVFFDTETTGLEAESCQIIELAAIRVEKTERGTLRMADSADVFVKLPEGERIPQKIVELTGITDEQLKNEGITEAEAAARFTELISGGRVLLVAHNAQFDLRRFCKRLNWKGIGGLAVTTVVIVFAVRGVVGMFSEHTQTKTAPITTSSPAAEESQPYVFYYKDGQAVSWEDVTDAWAAEAGIQKRYTLTDAERLEIAQVLTAEAGGEPFAGKIAVAQCILQTCEDEGIRPDEVLRVYAYSKRRPEPTQEALEAVQDVFDFGIVATTEPIKYFYAPALVDSEWHESQIYVMTINGHRFFKEATE